MTRSTDLGDIDVQPLPTYAFDAYQAHLKRLDRKARWLRFANSSDDRAVDCHVLRLLATRARVLVLRVGGMPRGAAELVPTNDKRIVEAAYSVEPDFQGRGLGARLVAASAVDARARGHDELRMDIHEANLAMILLAERAGSVLVDGGAMRAYALPLTDAARLRLATASMADTPVDFIGYV